MAYTSARHLQASSSVHRFDRQSLCESACNYNSPPQLHSSLVGVPGAPPLSSCQRNCSSLASLQPSIMAPHRTNLPARVPLPSSVLPVPPNGREGGPRCGAWEATSLFSRLQKGPVPFVLRVGRIPFPVRMMACSVALYVCGVQLHGLSMSNNGRTYGLSGMRKVVLGFGVVQTRHRLFLICVVHGLRESFRSLGSFILLLFVACRSAVRMSRRAVSLRHA